MHRKKPMAAWIPMSGLALMMAGRRERRWTRQDEVEAQAVQVLRLSPLHFGTLCC